MKRPGTVRESACVCVSDACRLSQTSIADFASHGVSFYRSHRFGFACVVTDRAGLADRTNQPAAPKTPPRDPPQTCADARHDAYGEPNACVMVCRAAKPCVAIERRDESRGKNRNANVDGAALGQSEADRVP